MTNITDKVKEKVKDVKEKVEGTVDKTTDTTKEKISSSASQGREFEEGAANRMVDRGKDPTQEYDEKEPMSPAKIKEHEPTAVNREMTERIVEPGQQGTSDPEKAREIARRSGMAKGT